MGRNELFDDFDESTTEFDFNESESESEHMEEMIFTDIPLDDEDQELVDVLDDAISDAELEEEQYKEYRPGHKFTQQELIRLKAEYNSDDPAVREKARELVYLNYRGLIHFVMKSYFSTYIARYHDELASQGNIAILTGFEAYDPNRNGQFYQPSTIITRHIRHEMRTFIARDIGGTTTKYHSTGQKMLEIIRRKKAAGEEINPGDIANELGISLKTARHSLEAITINSQKVSLDDTIRDGETKIMDLTPSEMETPEQAALKKEYNDNIHAALDTTLTSIQREAIILKYGFDGGPERSMKAIARIMGLPQEDMRAILASATTRLKRRMSTDSMFAHERRERINNRHIKQTQRTSDDLKRELESLDFSTIDDLDF